MKIDLITFNTSNPYINKILTPTSNNVADLFNTINPQNSDIVDTNRPWWAPNDTTGVFNSLALHALALYHQDPVEETFQDPLYNRMWLQYPNDQIQRLANEITEGLYDNDDKATAIIQWTLFNFPYQTDKKNYGHDELWAPPTFALATGSGDCEDGAFLVHSLMLHAGIPYDRIRTYGGLVKAGEGAATGGHAWTAYRRETDDEWVILDSSYYPTLKHVKDRPLMRNDNKYVENLFWFNQMYWTNTYDIDRIHNPGATYSAQGAMKNKINTLGWFVNNVA